jgi:Ca2+-binding RTX toxin-like protein
MTISYNTNWTYGSYENDLFQFVLSGEAIKTNSYFDGSSIAIGIGYDLIQHTPAEIQSDLGLTLTTTQTNLLIEAKTATAARREIIATELGLTITTDQAKATFEIVANNTYEDRLNNRLGITLPPSQERIALFSMVYNGRLQDYKDISTAPRIETELKSALSAGDRAKAWYVIRYLGSYAKNPIYANGYAKRAYYESEVFGLYDTNDTATNKDEALQVYRMFTAHRDMILQYEATYGNQIANTNTDYHLTDPNHQVQTLQAELSSAATVLMNQYINADYGLEHNFDPLNIQVASDKLPVLYGEDTTELTGSNADLLIGRDGGNDFMVGGAGNDLLLGLGGKDILDGGNGNDVLDGGDGQDTLDGGEGIDKLYGGDGNDTLIGGTGDDILIGGAGVDTYYIDGNDTIQDTGRNVIVYQGKVIAGAFMREGAGNTYHFLGDDGFTLTFNSPGHLTLNGTDSITFAQQTSAADFGDGDFGITLLEENPAQFDITLSGTADRDEMSIGMFWPSQNALQLCYTSFPPGTTSATPFYDQVLTGSAPSLNITGGDSGDFLFGFARHDEITGGAGNDIIIGNMGYWNGKAVTLTGAPEGDLLDGGAGNDWLQGAGEIDQLFGGEDNDLLSGFNGNDILLGDAGSDVLAGGSHADILSGGDGDDILVGEGYFTTSFDISPDNLSTLGVVFTASASGYYTGYVSYNFTINHNAPDGGDDILTGGAGRDMLFGGVGADTLDGGTESDSLFGWEGDDWLYGGAGNDWLVGDNGDLTGAGNDTLYGGDGNDLLYGLGGNDWLTGDAGADELYGFEGDDSLVGGGEDDNLDGGAGSDVLDGGSGGDTLLGGEGNDALSGGSGNDYLAGGDGNDSYTFSPGDGNDYLDDNAGQNSLTFSGSISLDSMSFSWATTANGMVTANLNGNDLLIQYSGNDSVTIANGRSNPTYTLLVDGEQLGYADILNLAAQEIIGTDGDDLLSGGHGDDSLAGLAGNDTLIGGLGADQLDGGTGSDTASYLNAASGVNVDLLNGTGTSGEAQGDILISIENLTGSAYDDMLTGNGDGNVLIGNSGNDTLRGDAGDDAQKAADDYKWTWRLAV